MLGSVSYSSLHELNFPMDSDDRLHVERVRNFTTRTFATARSYINKLGSPQVLLSENFEAECSFSAIKVIEENFPICKLAAVEKFRRGVHCLGDPSKMMSCQLAAISFKDIIEGLLYDLSFYQYLGSEAVVICIQHGFSGGKCISSQYKNLFDYFNYSLDTPTAKFLRAYRQLDL